MIQVPKFHANSLNKFIRAYLSNYFNALEKPLFQSLFGGISAKGAVALPTHPVPTALRIFFNLPHKTTQYLNLGFIGTKLEKITW